VFLSPSLCAARDTRCTKRSQQNGDGTPATGKKRNFSSPFLLSSAHFQNKHKSLSEKTDSILSASHQIQATRQTGFAVSSLFGSLSKQAQTIESDTNDSILLHFTASHQIFVWGILPSIGKGEYADVVVDLKRGGRLSPDTALLDWVLTMVVLPGMYHQEPALYLACSAFAF
jgi:hypothetical protein